MRNIVILNSLHFSYPLPILMRVSYNTLIVKQNTSDYYKYRKKMRIFLSREFREFFEVWVSFLQEGVFTLLCLFHEIVHQGGISGEFH